MHLPKQIPQGKYAWYELDEVVDSNQTNRHSGTLKSKSKNKDTVKY